MASKGTLEIKLLGDTKDLDRALGKASDGLSSFATGAAGVFAGAGIIAGGVFAKSFGDALDGEQIEDRLEASLSPTSNVAGEAGEIASRIFAGAWTDSLGEAADAVGIVASTLDELDAGGVEDITIKALDLSTVFEQDVSEMVNAVGVLLNTGLVNDADQAFDLMTRAFQEVPEAMRDELPQILEEYAKDFEALGISGPEAFGLIVDSAADGRFALDKTGDAIKEFSILAVEDGGVAGEAFDAIGLDADRMADMVQTGGGDAREALGLIVDALLDIEDPSEQATRAIEIFGAPVEDLGVQGIPEFLRRMDEMPDSMGDVEGAADDLGDSVNDNLKTRWDSALNSAQESMRLWIDENILPGATEVADAFGEDGIGGAVAKVAELWEAAQPEIEEWFTGTFQPFLEDTVVPWMEYFGGLMANKLMNALIEGIANSAANVLTVLGDLVEDAINLIPGLEGVDISPDFDIDIVDIPFTGDAPTTSRSSGGGGSTSVAQPSRGFFHTGGTFRAPVPGGQGMVMLRDGEKVSTPEDESVVRIHPDDLSSLAKTMVQIARAS